MAVELSPLERTILNRCQQAFPACDRPFAQIASELGIDEDIVLATLRRLQKAGVLSRIGGVVRSGRLGASTLAAMAVPEHDLERVAAIVSAFDEVNHNYRREHQVNLWFVVVAPDADTLEQVLHDMEAATGYRVLRLPMLEQYHIDLGFTI
ncbi:MAG: Lrp/AsnC family transcriptional regulator [Candidatus Dadabacteria bacterium]|nr:MAG: Lrp/AsnC family transcriptional regulator [Candidatus Dadabacteria bacterium]